VKGVQSALLLALLVLLGGCGNRIAPGGKQACDPSRPVSEAGAEDLSNCPSTDARVELSGRVMTSDHKPVFDAPIDIRSEDRPRNELSTIAIQTDSGGRFSMQVLPGRYSLRATKADLVSDWTQVQVNEEGGSITLVMH
jgi:hypothetical protein